MKTTEWKDTEIGRIPKDWEVKPLGEIGFFSKGSGVSRDQSHSGNLPCIRYGEIYTSHNNYIREFYSFISPKIAKQAKRLKNGDILFAGSGETKEEIGKTVAFVGNEEAYAGGDIIVLSPNVNCSSIFLGFVLNAPSSVHQKAGMGQGDAIVHIHKESLAKVLIPFPPKTEQQRIAKTLSDIDMLIASLDKAIEKKRLVKQGAMQQLLTGKKRLKGFTGEWQEVKLDDIVDIEKGDQINATYFVTGGKYPVMNGGATLSGYINKCNRGGDTIIISEGGNSCGYVNVMRRPFWCGGHCYSLKSKIKIDKEYLYQLLKVHEPQLMKLREGTGLPNIQRRSIKEFKLFMSSNLKEQSTISIILMRLDGEISSLTHEREKYLCLKDGMMQELLTGKTRLI